MGKHISKNASHDITPLPTTANDSTEKTEEISNGDVKDVTVANAESGNKDHEPLHQVQNNIQIPQNVEVEEEIIQPEIEEELEATPQKNKQKNQPRKEVPIPVLKLDIEHTLTFEDITEYVEETHACPEIVAYCLPLLQLRFHGQTSTDEETDVANETTEPNIGWYLSTLDGFLRKFKKFTDFTGNEEMFLNTLKLIAAKRCGEGGDVDKCFVKLVEESKRFVKIYHEREVHSEALEHQEYWGTRQQMLSAKIIGDWVDSENGPLDPIFGCLLHPTTGRVGPGDSGWIHDALFDDVGHMAYHGAVHDAFGYLITWHNIGPGYDYRIGMKKVSENCMSGQATGIHFWRHIMDVMDTKEKKIVYVSI